MDPGKLIVVACACCGRGLKAQRDWVGRRARCSRCGHRFRIGDPESEGRPPAAPVSPEAELAPVRGRRHHRSGERIEITGEWTAMLGWGERSVVVEFDPDLGALFAGREFDLLWPQDTEYAAFVASLDDATEYLRAQWTACYLHHPRRSVVARMLDLLGDDYRLSVSRSLIDLLGRENGALRGKAAKALWRKGPVEVAHALGQLSGAEQEAAAKALRDACPPEYEDEFSELRDPRSPQVSDLSGTAAET